MKKIKYLSAVLTIFTLIFVISVIFTAQAADNEYRYTCDYMYEVIQSSEEKQFYDDLKESCEIVDNSYERYDHIELVPIPRSMNDDRVLEIMMIFIYDNPQYFWLDVNYDFKGREPWRVKFYSNGYFTLNVLDYFRDGDVRQAAKIKVMSAAQEYIDGALRYSTQYERARYLYRRLLDEVEYQEGEWDQTIASVFLQKQTVCAGYSKAYAMLCNAVGIDALSTTSVSHAWNIIKLSDYWFIVDITNDNNSYKYFLLSDRSTAEEDSRMSASIHHIIDRNAYVRYYDSYPKCLYDYKEVESTMPAPEYILGDANNDGIVNVRDVAFIAKCLSKGNGSILPVQADCDRDGKITVRDAAALAFSLASGTELF